MGEVIGGIGGGIAQAEGTKAAAKSGEAASKYSVDVGRKTAQEQMRLSELQTNIQKQLAEKGLLQQRYGTDVQAQLARERMGQDIYSTDVQAELARRGLAQSQQRIGLEQAQQQQLSEAYRGAYQRGLGEYGAGEEQLAGRFEQAPEELEILRQQALTGQAEELQQGARQLQSGLAAAGVRGGQAATQMRRGIGEMTEAASRDIQGLMAGEAIDRAAQQRQYDIASQMARQQFLLSPESARYSQQTSPEQAAYQQQLMENYQGVRPEQVAVTERPDVPVSQVPDIPVPTVSNLPEKSIFKKDEDNDMAAYEDQIKRFGLLGMPAKYIRANFKKA